MLTQGGIDVTLEFLRGLAADEMDQAAGRVASIQGALRTLEDLDAFQVEQLTVVAGQGRLVNAIEIDRDRRFVKRREIVQADAAQRKRHGNVVVGVQVETECGRLPG